MSNVLQGTPRGPEAPRSLQCFSERHGVRSLQTAFSRPPCGRCRERTPCRSGSAIQHRDLNRLSLNNTKRAKRNATGPRGHPVPCSSGTPRSAFPTVPERHGAQRAPRSLPPWVHNLGIRPIHPIDNQLFADRIVQNVQDNLFEWVLHVEAAIVAALLP